MANSIGHELRIDLLRILNERAASPKELVELLDEDLSDVLHHIKELWAHGCIDLVKKESGGGEADHFYRITPFFSLNDWESHSLSTAAREEFSATILQSIIAESVAALQSGSLDSRADRHLSWMPMRLDEEGWRETMAMFTRMLKEAEAIKERCIDRLGPAGKAGTSVIVAMMGFERSKSPATEP